MNKTVIKRTRTSVYLPVSYIEAMNVIRQEKMILNSHQIEIALRKHFEENRKLLESKGVKVWQK